VIRNAVAHIVPVEEGAQESSIQPRERGAAAAKGCAPPLHSRRRTQRGSAHAGHGAPLAWGSHDPPRQRPDARGGRAVPAAEADAERPRANRAEAARPLPHTVVRPCAGQAMRLAEHLRQASTHDHRYRRRPNQGSRTRTCSGRIDAGAPASTPGSRRRRRIALMPPRARGAQRMPGADQHRPVARSRAGPKDAPWAMTVCCPRSWQPG
jgi:hypothetical protein